MSFFLHFSRIFNYSGCKCISSLLLVKSNVCDITCRDYSKYISREARFMNKMLSKGHSKRKFKIFDIAPVTSNFRSEKPTKKVNTRRITVLNKLFMEHITNLLATEKWHHNLIEKGFEVTRVAVAPDFKNVNVFWLAPLAEEMDSILTDIARKMHHELTQLQLMGTVPKITFVKDTQKEKLLEVEHLLQKISSEGNSFHHCSEEKTEEIPEMAMDVYDLNHEKIMKKIGFGPSKKLIHDKTTEEHGNKTFTAENKD